MKRKYFIISCIICTIVLFALSQCNIKLGWVLIPENDDMMNVQISYITIGTVFAGFAFTSLGLLLGLSSEKLIKKISNTNIIMHKVNNLIYSIIYFVFSVICSLYFVLGLNITLFNNMPIIKTMIDEFLYFLVLGYMMAGIGFFVYSIVELYDLIKRVYGYNVKEVGERINKTKHKLSQGKEELSKRFNVDEDMCQ